MVDSIISIFDVSLQNDTAVVNVTVSNVNEWAPHFDRDDYTFSVNHSGGIPAGIQIGRLRVADKDVSDRISLQLKPTPPARCDIRFSNYYFKLLFRMIISNYYLNW